LESTRRAAGTDQVSLRVEPDRVEARRRRAVIEVNAQLWDRAIGAYLEGVPAPVVLVARPEQSLGAEDAASGAGKVARTLTLATKCERVLAGGVVDANDIVLRVGDKDPARLVERNAGDLAEAILVARLTGAADAEIDG
jgi:hypothetical protein